MKIISKIFSFLILIFLLISSNGCKKEEQGRPLSYKKGFYQGNPDNTLSSNKIYQLKKRISGQSWY
tara:strand:- start:1371 stop:1568 length:198 start_codon:yes stop_codon:yes gene_type:complete